jgi:segregation and condensation protein B
MELKHILEVLLFHAQKPLSIAELRDALGQAADDPETPEAKPWRRTKEAEVQRALDALVAEHEAAQRSFRLVCVAGAWQFVSQPEFAPWVRALAGKKSRPPRLSQPALETLAVIAYRQPVTRAQIEQIRGVSVDGVMQTLIERGLVEQTGRADVVGRPLTYGTTPQFLEYFGLGSLDGLPAADELRQIQADRPDGLLTADPGLATAPPTSLQAEDPAAQEAVGSTPGGTSPVSDPPLPSETASGLEPVPQPETVSNGARSNSSSAPSS